MDELCEYARDGNIDAIDVAIYEDRYIIDLHQLAMCAIDGDQLDTLIYLIHQGGVHGLNDLYDYAVTTEKWNIVQYLSDMISSSQLVDVFTTTMNNEASILEEMVRDNDIEQVREMMNEKIVTPNEVALLAVKYDNRPLLISTIKRGANDYDAMIKVAKEQNNTKFIELLERSRDADMYYYYGDH
jgi:hypothetical protein